MSLKQTTSCLGYQQITVTTAQSLTVPARNPVTGEKQQATYILVTPEVQNVRWRDDGTDPTASVGMPVWVGNSLRYDGDLTKIRFIAATAGAIINVSYYA